MSRGPMFCAMFLAAICTALIAPCRLLAAPATQPMRVELDNLDALLIDLGSIDPALRDRAREELMLLDAGELPQLKAAVEKLETISIAQSVALKEVVVHVHATGQHKFEGGGRALLGISRATINAADQGD